MHLTFQYQRHTIMNEQAKGVSKTIKETERRKEMKEENEIDREKLYVEEGKRHEGEVNKKNKEKERLE